MRRLAMRIVSFGMVISSAFMAWKFITCLYGSEPPVTIIVADSMGPGLQKGDILLVTTDLSPIQCGDVIMFHVKEGSVPVVHRVIQVTKRRDTGEVHLLTKGDNSPEDDRSGVYTNNQLWLNPKDHVIGRVIGYIPYIGWARIIVSTHPFVKYLLLVAIGLLVLVPNSNNRFRLF